jgi:hypothetical protein
LAPTIGLGEVGATALWLGLLGRDDRDLRDGHQLMELLHPIVLISFPYLAPPQVVDHFTWLQRLPFMLLD